MARIATAAVVFLLAVETALCFVNTTLKGLDNNELMPDTRRKKDMSTSSSSGERKSLSDDDNKESLDNSYSSDSSSSSGNKKYPKPKSSLERRGWRKWHRKCTKCPEDMRKKWRDPSINWICGAYQRARRSFKSLCMMHYRNCQDGTMFTKISNRRCPNSSRKDEPRRGDHFFYDYKAALRDDSSSESAETSESSQSRDSLFDW